MCGLVKCHLLLRNSFSHKTLKEVKQELNSAQFGLGAASLCQALMDNAVTSCQFIILTS